MEAKFKIRGIVEIKVIDKDTGKVVKHIKEHNAITSVGAFYVAKTIDGEFTTVTPWKAVLLYKTTTGATTDIITGLTGTFSTASDSGTAVSTTLTVTDSSTNAYTVASLGLTDSPANSIPLSSCYATYVPTSAVSKASNQTLQITWTIQVAHS